MTRAHWIAVGGLVAGLGLLLGLGWQFLLKPQGVAHKQMLEQKAQLEQKLAEARQRAAQFERFKAEAENVRRDLDFYVRRLDPDLSASELYTLVAGIGHSFNFRTWSFTAKERAKTSTARLDLDEVEIEAKFESDYQSVGRFMNLCISQVRLLVPESMTLEAQTDAEGVYNDTLRAQVNFKVFVSTPTKGKGGRK